jgi:hypothetical protein
MFDQSFTSNKAFNKFIEKLKIVKSTNKKRVNQESCILGPLEITVGPFYNELLGIKETIRYNQVRYNSYTWIFGGRKTNPSNCKNINFI